MVRGWFPSRGHRNTSTTTTKKKKFNVRFFRLDTLRVATNNFSTYLGGGGYGSVFKGVLPHDGRTVAIKRHLKPYDGFLEMVEFMSHLRHINLIQVIGCCVENGEQILVCEYAENRNVSMLLHGDKSLPAFDWKTRAAVCIGTARGLCYLHEEVNPRVIHRDIKPTNILLDANLVPKIADFDLMYVADGNLYDEAGGLRIATVKGTLAYLDPNYLLRGQLTEKVDVYSFGLTILEIVTGRKAVDWGPPREADDGMILNWMILNWVTRARKEGRVLEIVDPKLTDFPKDDVERFINVALLCTRATPELRPSMFEVVHMLYGRHKSEGEISEMALAAIADQPEQWSVAGSYHSGSMSSTAFSISENSEARDIISSTMGIDCAAETQSRETNDKAECSSSNAELTPAAAAAAETTILASSGKEDESRPEDVVREYFERSMDKIMRIQVARHRRTRAVNKFCEQVSMEVVYPPFLSGEYPPPSRSEY